MLHLHDSHIRSEIYFRKLLGRTDIEDALTRLSGVIQNEVPMAVPVTAPMAVPMAVAPTMITTSDVNDGVQLVQPATSIHSVVRTDIKKEIDSIEKMTCL